MRLKTVPRRVNRREGTCVVISGEKCREIVNAKNETLLDLKNPTGLDLSTKKISKTKEPDLYKIQRKTEASLAMAPKICDLNGFTICQKTKMYHEPKMFQEIQFRQDVEAPLINPAEKEKLKESFLYRIMTDPQFIENLQKNKKKKPSCQFCKKEFETEADVKDHLNVRLDESKRVTCCACEKSFAQKRYLRYHQRCHSDRSKYVCGICMRKYSRMDNLTRHNIFHTNPDKFPCTMCERAFARKDLLNKHQKSHENKYKWHCNTCRKYFKGPVSLDNHMKSFHIPEVNCNESQVTCPSSNV